MRPGGVRASTPVLTTDVAAFQEFQKSNTEDELTSLLIHTSLV